MLAPGSNIGPSLWHTRADCLRVARVSLHDVACAKVEGAKGVLGPALDGYPERDYGISLVTAVVSLYNLGLSC
jgi:hypothetical protein